MKVNLASTSPRRRQLLQQIGIDYELVNVNIDEAWSQPEPARTYVMRMALEKATAAKSKVDNELPIIAADTIAVLNGTVLGKAGNKREAAHMLRQLSGKTHQIYTATALICNTEQVRLNISHVRFRPLSEADINAYCLTGEPLGKAGAYAIQGQAAAFVEYLQGSYSGVMGLPLHEIDEMLRKQTEI